MLPSPFAFAHFDEARRHWRRAGNTETLRDTLSEPHRDYLEASTPQPDLMLSPLNQAFLRISKRAETYDRAHLVATFVDVGALFTLLSNPEHQVLYGRRGTGKTHAMAYLSDAVEAEGDISVEIDLRAVGSSGGIYTDQNIPLAERATRLLVDTLSRLHDELLEAVIDRAEALNLATAGPALDRLADAISEVEVVGPVEVSGAESETTNSERSQSASAGLSLQDISASASSGTSEARSASRSRSVSRSGVARHRVHFGTVQAALRELANALHQVRVWVLLDEWSEVPMDLQPYLADLLRRSVFPVRGYSVKLAAIEQRTEFRSPDGAGGYVGIEVGADIASSVNLDDFMVFDNDRKAASEFFRHLAYKHVRSVLEETKGAAVPSTPAELVRQAFTQRNAFDEFVRAAEGVPRDAINLLGVAGQRAGEAAISVPVIRDAARTWYVRGKEKAVSSRPEARDLLQWIIDEVIAHRRARAFLLRSGTRDPLIHFLFDSRVLHVVKHGVSTHDEPGARYDVYGIDYGCYVELINTANAPLGLFEAESESDASAGYVEVPANDYRSIRRAILDLERFYNRR